MTDVDVIVVGSGFAGLAAALAARAQGASVVIFEASGIPGGTSKHAGGMLMGAGTRQQREQGIDDDVDRFYTFYMAMNSGLVEPGLVRTLTDESGDYIEYLVGLGMKLRPKLMTAGEEDVPRLHMVDGEGAALHQLLLQKVQEAGVDLVLGTPVTRLLIEDGRVTGVVAGNDETTANAVVLATGGFGANEHLLDQYVPAMRELGDWAWYAGERSAQGSIFDLVAPLHAQISTSDIACRFLTPNFGPMLEGGYLPGWLVVVNGTGRRFYNETVSYSGTQPIIEAQPGPIWAIFDDAARLAAQRSTAELSKKVVVEGRIDRAQKWIQPMIDEMVEKGVVLRADSLEELAELANLPVENLAGSIERYNHDVDLGLDSQYRKPADVMVKVASPPFYATELRLAHLVVTSVGPRIDAAASVLDERSRPIPGLYAAGECAGGVIGPVYMGGGNSIMNCLVFGRIAGQHAAALQPATEVA